MTIKFYNYIKNRRVIIPIVICFSVLISIPFIFMFVDVPPVSTTSEYLVKKYLYKAYVPKALRGFADEYKTSFDKPIAAWYVANTISNNQNVFIDEVRNDPSHIISLIQPLSNNYIHVKDNVEDISLINKASSKVNHLTVPSEMIPYFKGDAALKYYRPTPFKAFDLGNNLYLINFGYNYSKGGTFGYVYLFNEITHKFDFLEDYCTAYINESTNICPSIWRALPLDSENALLISGSGDSCWSLKTIYLLDIRSRKTTKIDSFVHGCNKDSQKMYLGYNNGIVYANINSSNPETNVLNILNISLFNPLTGENSILLTNNQLMDGITSLTLIEPSTLILDIGEQTYKKDLFDLLKTPEEYVWSVKDLYNVERYYDIQDKDFIYKYNRRNQGIMLTKEIRDATELVSLGERSGCITVINSYYFEDYELDEDIFCRRDMPKFFNSDADKYNYWIRNHSFGKEISTFDLIVYYKEKQVLFKDSVKYSLIYNATFDHDKMELTAIKSNVEILQIP